MLGIIALASLLSHVCPVAPAGVPAVKSPLQGRTQNLPGLQGETKYPPGLQGGTTKLPGLQGQTQYPPGLRGTAPSPQKLPTSGPNLSKPTAKFLCGNASSCSFGDKRSCLLTDGIKSPVKCVSSGQTCESVWNGYCKKPSIPICKDEITECLCSCGQRDGFLGWLF